MGFFFSEINEDVDFVNLKNTKDTFELNREEKSILKNVIGVTEHNGKLMFDKQGYQDHHGGNSLSDDFWMGLVADLDKNTRGFLIDSKLNTVDEVFNE